ncbi:MAG TPA: alpha-2-macroglobulin family protein [Terracidiphilus sp.]|jgi:hypothetical protein|nr:alpha-2-macroglobulin family protein [Terracidiphilus sp.]
MIRYQQFLAAILGLSLAWTLADRAGAADPVEPITVNEGAAVATLRAHSIRLELRFAAPVVKQVRATAWLMAAEGAPSGETTAEVAAHSSSVRMVLPWPNDARGKPAEDIGWYRIGYRIEADGSTVAQGILSVGAIAPNLMALRLAHPRELAAGSAIGLRVFAGNPVTRHPYGGVQLKATLSVNDDADKGKSARQTLNRSAVTGANGEAEFTFPPCTRPGQTATLTVDGTLSGVRNAEESAFAHATLSTDLETSDRETFHNETDKPLHKPGETVHLRTLLLDDSGRAVANSSLALTVTDPDDKTLLKVPLTTNRYGIASYDWKTTPQTATGEYEASFDDSDSTGNAAHDAIRLRIERYELPEFNVTASLDRPYYLEGQSPTVTLHAGYLFGKPVAAGLVKITRDEAFSYEEKKAPEKTEAAGSLGTNGDASFHLDVKSDFDEFKSREYERSTDIRYRAVVTDATTGRSEPRSFTLRLTRDPVHIYVSELGGNAREGEYIVSTSYADGVPVACKISMDWIGAHSRGTRAAVAQTNRYGLAKVNLRWPSGDEAAADSLNLRVVARDPQGRTSTFDDAIYSKRAGAMWISVSRSLLKPGEPVEAILHGTVGDNVDVDVLSAAAVLKRMQVHLAHASEPIAIPSDSRFRGLISLRAYTLNPEAGDDDTYSGYGESGSYKSVLYPEDRELRVKLAGVQASYLPGADVQATLRLSDASGAPALGAVGVSVFDSAVEQRASTEEDANDEWSGGRWWLDSAEAGGITRADLDKTDNSQAIPDDLQLAAEAVLANEPPNDIAIEGTSDEAMRNQYRQAMEYDLKPLAQAMVAVTSPRLPRTLESIRAAARSARIADEVLLDPWTTPYQAQYSIYRAEETVSLLSAGPDKRFNTSDDLVNSLATRNVFAVPGERLTRILKSAAESGQPLPGNPEALKSLASAHGLDLDSDEQGTRGPNCKPYKYAFVVKGRFYSIQALDQNEEVWTSPLMSYFAHTEARMEAAIRAWNEAAQPFPATDAAARQALAEGGIDVDGLRDPLGRALSVRATQRMAYTQVEQVKAAGELQVHSKPVTRLFRAIQVVRAPDEALGETSENPEVVAEFLQPLTEQSGSDLKPQAADQGTFKGNTGAIGGTVTDQTGAVIPKATVRVKGSAGIETTAVTSANGMYIVSDLTPGYYAVTVLVPGFLSFEIIDVRVSSASLTTVDVELKLGTTNETVTVEASSVALATDSAEVAAVGAGVASPKGKSRVTSAAGSATVSEATFTPRLRHVFDETAWWAPSLETGANGRVALHFRLPDSLTTWKLHGFASTADGRIGSIDRTFQTFQPLFVDLDAPQVLTQGDEIALPILLRNYTAREVNLPVTVQRADWFQVVSQSAQRVAVPANATAPVTLTFRAANTIGQGPLRVTAADAHQGDAVEKSIRVHPDGQPGAVAASALLRERSTSLGFELPANVIPGSLHADLLLYPNLGSQLLQSIKASLERPYGCGEQIISSSYPSLLFLQLLRSSKSNSSAEGEAQSYLQLGYDRLDGYFDNSGGVTYWGPGDHDPDAALTAYAIEFLTDARPFLRIDEDRISAAVRWLVQIQQKDGAWRPRHGEPTAETTLYIAHALAEVESDPATLAGETKQQRASTQAGIARALAWASHSAAAIHDPYANAIRLEFAAANADAAAIERLRAELISAATRDRDGLHWSRGGYSPFFGWGRAGDLETAAMALSALEATAASAADRAASGDVLLFLLHSRDRYGIWLSGQATVRVLQALLPMAIQQLKSPPKFGVTLSVNGAPLNASLSAALESDTGLVGAPRSIDITELLKPGSNQLVFTTSSDAAVASVELAAGFYTPWPATRASTGATTGKEFGLNFSYRCNADNARAGQPVDCTVDARRFGSGGYGMLLTEVGLPPGADVDRPSLARLLDSGTILRYELQPDRIVFYLWSWKAEGSRFTFRFTPRYALRARAAPATLFDYYNPDLQVVLAPQSFTIQ